jgi:hypothetical protein
MVQGNSLIPMHNNQKNKSRKPSAGGRIIASLKEALDWAEGKNVPVRVTTVEVPTIDVRATRKRPSQFDPGKDQAQSDLIDRKGLFSAAEIRKPAPPQ